MNRGDSSLAVRGGTFLIAFAIGLVSIFVGFMETLPALSAEDQQILKDAREKVIKWRQERDQFFKSHQRSPLTSIEKSRFEGLAYFSFDPAYFFEGQIKREILNINDPKYYATFLTNKGTNKRYIRYGKFHFRLDGKNVVIEVYKSILSDMLFIPFKDKTNGKETYEGGRYIDAEILPGYKMVLNFNEAYNPSCAYNERFICAMPPKENDLNIEIKAGEKDFK